MNWVTFLQIIIPICIFVFGIIISLFVSNNHSHKEIWKQLNSNSVEITNRLTKIETILTYIKNNNGGKK